MLSIQQNLYFFFLSTKFFTINHNNNNKNKPIPYTYPFSFSINKILLLSYAGVDTEPPIKKTQNTSGVPSTRERKKKKTKQEHEENEQNKRLNLKHLT